MQRSSGINRYWCHLRVRGQCPKLWNPRNVCIRYIFPLANMWVFQHTWHGTSSRFRQAIFDYTLKSKTDLIDLWTMPRPTPSIEGYNLCFVFRYENTMSCNSNMRQVRWHVYICGGHVLLICLRISSLIIRHHFACSPCMHTALSAVDL